MAGEDAARSGLGRSGLLVDGRYRLADLIGRGGFGEVWRARHEVDGAAVRDVALKLLRAPRGAQVEWLNEVRAIRDVRCSSIATVYDVGVARNEALAFIAMELLDGRTLEARLQAGRIYWRRALAIARDIAAALDTCHAVGVSHCDLKPQNVLLGAGHQVWVLDFGVAALDDHAPAVPEPGDSFQGAFVDGTGAVAIHEVPGSLAPATRDRIVGTPGYIPPEVLSGQRPGPAGDVYALGIVLYRMIAGGLPHTLPSGMSVPSNTSTDEQMSRYRAALVSATLRRELTPLSAADATLPPAVVALVDRMLAINPDERPTGASLAAAIDEVFRRPWGLPDPPYVGLEAFDGRRAGHMFGRDADCAQITDLLAERPAIVLCGPSGCGKSSLAMAGVAARIDERMLDDMDGWRQVIVRPSGGPGALGDAIAGAENGDRRIGTVLVVDQLEELLRLSDDERISFGRQLATLAEATAAEGAAIRLVATVRDDLFGRIAALPELRRFPERSLYTVRGVDPNAVPEIVRGPAEAAGYRIEGGDEVIAEATGVLSSDASALPLVQFALTRWWEQRDDQAKQLPRAEWETIGGIQGALADVAQEIFDGLATDERRAMRELLVQLFRPDGTRVQVDEERAARDGTSAAVARTLVARRLIRRHVEASGGARLEVVHEALAHRWPQLHTWLEETRAERELLADVHADATRWRTGGREPDLLWRGARLDTALRLRDRLVDERDFVDAAIDLDRRRRRGRRSVIGLIGVLAAVAVVLVVSYLASVDQRKRADQAREAAEESLAQAEDARQQAEAARTQAELDARRNATLRGEAEKLKEQAEAQVRLGQDELQMTNEELKQQMIDFGREKTRLAAERSKVEADMKTAQEQMKKATAARQLAEKESQSADAARKLQQATIERLRKELAECRAGHCN